MRRALRPSHPVSRPQASSVWGVLQGWGYTPASLHLPDRGYGCLCATTSPGHLVAVIITSSGHLIAVKTSSPGHLVAGTTTSQGHLISVETTSPGQFVALRITSLGYLVAEKPQVRVTWLVRPTRVSKAFSHRAVCQVYQTGQRRQTITASA